MAWVPRSITADRVSPVDARQVRLQCPHCQGFATVDVPWGCSSDKRQRLIKAAIEEHRVVCTGADASAGRVYQIEYPRA